MYVISSFISKLTCSGSFLLRWHFECGKRHVSFLSYTPKNIYVILFYFKSIKRNRKYHLIKTIAHSYRTRYGILSYLIEEKCTNVQYMWDMVHFIQIYKSWDDIAYIRRNLSQDGTFPELDFSFHVFSFIFEFVLPMSMVLSCSDEEKEFSVG